MEAQFSFLVTTIVLNVQDGSCNGLQHYAALGRDRVIFCSKFLVYTSAYIICVEKPTPESMVMKRLKIIIMGVLPAL